MWIQAERLSLAVTVVVRTVVKRQPLTTTTTTTTPFKSDTVGLPEGPNPTTPPSTTQSPPCPGPRSLSLVAAT